MSRHEVRKAHARWRAWVRVVTRVASYYGVGFEAFWQGLMGLPRPRSAVVTAGYRAMHAGVISKADMMVLKEEAMQAEG